jgi:hypothetical protein
VPGDPGAKLGHAEGVGIAQTVRAERGAGDIEHKRGRAGARLADLEMYDVLAGSLAPVGLTHHVHDDKRRNPAALSNLQSHLPAPDGSPH